LPRVRQRIGWMGSKIRSIQADPIEENIYEMDFRRITGAGIDTLPTSPSLALDHLESDNVVRRALGEHAYAAFMRIASAEWDMYRV